MKHLRTPDQYFENLLDYPFCPNYLTIDDGDGGELRLHYLDESSSDGLDESSSDGLDESSPDGVDEGGSGRQVVLLMHGEPSWSYLYRKMVPGLVDAGYRVIVPDLAGFGRSDKPSERSDYTYQRHVDWMTSWFNQLALQNVVLFCQDWGGLIGLRLVAENADRFAGVVAANTFLPTGDQAASEAFLNWQKFSQTVPEFPAGGIIKGATVTKLSHEVIAAYDAPYPDETYKEGARQFPLLVPTSPDDPASEINRAAWKVLAKFDKPFLTAFSDQDPITRGGDISFQKMIPGAAGQAHVTIKDGGHFLQEDKGEELAQLVIKFINDNNITAT